MNGCDGSIALSFQIVAKTGSAQLARGMMMRQGSASPLVSHGYKKL